MKKRAKSLGTHSGTFHADEITACALLIVHDLVDPQQIYRTRDPQLLSECEFVCDVGGVYAPADRLFDHHQVSYEGTLSSAGMVLRWLRDEGYFSVDEFEYFRQNFVDGVDAHDNGRAELVEGHCSFSGVISNFTPISYQASPEEQDAAFHQALDLVLGHVKRLRARFLYHLSCRTQVSEVMKKYETCLMFEHPLPWLEAFFDLGGEAHPARFVIMPTGKHWKLRGIPPCYERRMEVRLPLPGSWAGLLDEELKSQSGIEGAIFCHKGRFISVWETREDALKALHHTLNLEDSSDG